MTTTKKTQDVEKVPVHVALARVMHDVTVVKKEGFNQHQRYQFRGIDGVMNAVGPALRNHGVVPVMQAEKDQFDLVAGANGRTQRQVLVKYTLNFIGPEGDMLPNPIVVYGEATDYSDKAMAKAHSVAYRTALLQVFCLPTDEQDPDEYSDPIHKNAVNGLLEDIQKTNDVETLRDMWKHANEVGVLTPEVKNALNARVKELSNDKSDQSGAGGTADSEPVEQDS